MFRKSHDATKMSAQTTRLSPETNRMSPETNRMSPETNRMSPETTRMSPETTRMGPDMTTTLVPMGPDIQVDSDQRRHSMTALTAASSLRHIKPPEHAMTTECKLCCGFSAAEILMFIFSFSLGALRFSMVSMPYGYLIYVAQMAPVEATMVCHANMACMYLSEVLAGVVSKTRLGVSKTLIALTALLFMISVTIMVSRTVYNVRSAPVVVVVTTMLLMCTLLGGVIHCFRLTTLNEFDLPHEYPRFLHIKFFVTEFEYIGKTVGGFWGTGGYKPGPSGVTASSIWLIFSSIVLIVSLIGPKVFQREKDDRNIIGEFLKHTFYVLKANLLNKQNEEKFSADDMERIKIVHSATILYVPVIILIGLKDLKYSRYTWQSLELVLNINGMDMSPQKILMLYPLTVTIFLPITYYVINPFFKKKVASHKTRITTRAIVAFYFMAASLAFATILQCRIEMNQRNQSRNGSVSIFNFLPCNATMRVLCGEANHHVVDSLQVTRIPCPQANGEFDPTVIQGKCVIDGVKRFFSMSVVLVNSLDSLVAVGYDFHMVSKSFVGNRTYPIYVQHLHNPHQQELIDGALLLVHNVIINHSIALVPAKLSKHNFWIPTGKPVYTKLLSSFDNSHVKTINVEPGRYGIILDNQIATMIDYRQSKTYAILVAHEQHYNVKVKTILLSEKRTKSVLYQIPQVLMSGLAEMVIESPGFVYGRKKIPIEWRDFSQTIWTFSCFLGNSLIVAGTALFRGERNLLAFITGTAASVISIALITIFLLDYFKADYEDDKRDE